MGYFPVRYESRVVIYERKMFIRLATGFTQLILTEILFDATAILVPSGEKATHSTLP